MAVIQLTPQVPSLFINGVDFTSNLTEITGNWSNFSLNGLYIITGRLVMEDVIGGSQTLDDRYNTNLCRGAKIEFATNGELAPVIGTTFIESSQFNEINGIQTISFTCLLGLHNSKTARDIGTCVQAGSTTSVDQAIQDFLVKSGISLGDISVAGIPGTIFQSTFSEAGGSFISSAGQLAFANGYSLYQDYQGVIRAIPYTPPFRANVFSGLAANTVQWERFQDSTLPPDKVCVTFATAGGSGSGSRRTCTSGADYGQNNIFNDDGNLFEARTDVTQLETTDTTEIDRENREVNYSQITERNTDVYNAEQEAAQSAGGSSGGSGRRNSRIVTENQIIEERYETSGGSSGISPGGGDTINGCYPRDEGRLIFRQTGTYAPAREIFAAYRAAAIQGYGGTVEALKAEGQDAAAAELKSRIAVADSDARRLVNLKTETWSYNIPSSDFSPGSTSTAFVDDFLESGEGNFAPGCDPGEGGYVGFSTSGSSGSGNGNANSAGTVVYESSEIGIMGNLIPFIGDPTFGTGDPTNEDDPKLFVQASLQVIKSRNTQIWSLQGDRQTWKSTSSTWQIGIEANPELVEAKRIEAEEEDFTTNAGLQNMLTVARTLRRVAGQDAQDNPPGDPGRIPPEERVQFQPDKVVVDVVSQYGCPVERTVSVALGEFCNSRDTASAVGQAVGLIDWARTKAQLFSVDLASLPDRSLHPLNTFSFIKPNGAVEVYAVDSPTVVYSQNEAIFAATGLFVGLTTANGENASDPTAVNPGFGGEPPVPPLELSGEITVLPLDENNEVDIANLPSNVVILPPAVPPPDGFIGVVILDGTAAPPAQIPNVVVLGPGSPPPNNVPNLVILPGVSPPTSTPVWSPDVTVDPPVSPNYTLSNVVACPETPQPCIEITFCTVQIAPNVGGDLEIFCDDFDDCFLDSTGLGPGSYFDIHPVIIDRFTFSNGNGIILQSVTPAAGSYLSNESQVTNACIFPRCNDIFASPPQEDPLVIAP